MKKELEQEVIQQDDLIWKKGSQPNERVRI